MTEDGKLFYKAAPGETVTLKAAITGDAFVAVGEPMEPGENQTTWILKIPQSGFLNPYIFKARVDFVDPPAGSKVDFIISGSNGGSFSGFPIDPSSIIKTEDFVINVV
jgi:hypothetical protein